MSAPDTRLLRYFLAVARELHFGRAAASLYVSQPALSQQLRKLEGELGAPLFERDRRSVSLTATGRALLEPARRAVEAADDFAVAARLALRAHQQELTVGFHNRWPGALVPRVLRRFARERPDVSVAVRQADYRDSTAGLRTGDADVALVHLPLSGDRIRTRVIATTHRVAVLAADHPLAGRPQVTVAELVATGIPWAVPPPEADPEWRRSWGALDERAALGADLATDVHPVTIDAYLGQVAGGRLVGLNDALIEVEYRPPGVAFVPVADAPPSERAVAWRRDEQREEVATLVAAVVAVAADAA